MMVGIRRSHSRLLNESIIVLVQRFMILMASFYIPHCKDQSHGVNRRTPVEKQFHRPYKFPGIQLVSFLFLNNLPFR